MTKQDSGAAFAVMLFMSALLLFFGGTDVIIKREPTVALIFCPACGRKKPPNEFNVKGLRRSRVCKVCEGSPVQS